MVFSSARVLTILEQDKSSSIPDVISRSGALSDFSPEEYPVLISSVGTIKDLASSSMLRKFREGMSAT